MTHGSSLPEVGRRLTSARLQRGLSQGTVARLAGIAPSYLSRIENGRIQPTFRTVLRIQRALGVTLEELVGPSLRHGETRVCPISDSGRCVLDLIRPDREALRDAPGESYSPREVRLLRCVAAWVKQARPDRVRALELLVDELLQATHRRRGGSETRR